MQSVTVQWSGVRTMVTAGRGEAFVTHLLVRSLCSDLKLTECRVSAILPTENKPHGSLILFVEER